MINSNCNEVEFLGKGIHNFTKQVHYIDNNFNEFALQNINIDKRDWFELNDTCANIPIKFKNNKYYNCVLLLQKKSNNTVLFESHFSFIQNDDKNQITITSEILENGPILKLFNSEESAKQYMNEFCENLLNRLNKEIQQREDQKKLLKESIRNYE